MIRLQTSMMDVKPLLTSSKILTSNQGETQYQLARHLNIKRRRSSMHHSTTMRKKKRKRIRAEKKRKADANKSRGKDLPSWWILNIDL